MSSPSSDLRVVLAPFGGVVRENVDLAPFLHVRLGGPARWFVEPRTEADVARVVRACNELGWPLRVLGGGSNLLVADEGVDGVVLSLAAFQRTVRDGTLVTAGAGVSLPSLLRQTKDAGLAGLETLVGVPAQVGGAVAMNAGTREGETFAKLASLVVVTPSGETEVWDRARMRPRYRDGGLDGAIVLHATFALEPDDPAAIFARLEASLKRRNATQPVTEKSVGCVFQNPECAPAAKLIDDAGCKLMRVGRIVVSAKHANYFVNEGGGTCRDFLALVAAVQERVRDRFGVELVPEVKIWR
ncbi:MAG TPA: UDP-N-acetylmuramate dehydrogenase [Planctomycetota bacterium]|nr:UDP-N-acetylmuramate dehydrogenase [Planctomycetota bacterium]